LIVEEKEGGEGVGKLCRAYDQFDYVMGHGVRMSHVADVNTVSTWSTVINY